MTNRLLNSVMYEAEIYGAMMNTYEMLSDKSLTRGRIDDADILDILEGKTPLLQVLDAAYTVRRHYYGNRVRVQVIRNVKNGGCSEDCGYCAQSSNTSNVNDCYPFQSDEEIMEGAHRAHENGAYRYCLVFSGRKQPKTDIDRICGVVRGIKKQYAMDVCVSAGFIGADEAAMLRDAGVGRYNHNLNTSADYYAEICSTHGYADRLETIRTAKSVGLEVCSGVIIGMGESHDDILGMMNDLRSVDVKSIPVNFFIPVEGHRIKRAFSLTPEYCIRVLCAFRLAFPPAELRVAGGREYHLRTLQAMSLYAVNSLFAKGYLTRGGDSFEETKQMIDDAGFVIESVEEE